MENQIQESKAKRGVPWGVFVSAVASIMIAVVTSWVGINKEIAVQGVKVLNLELQQVRIESKLDRISDKLEAINLSLQNKADKK